MVGPSGLEYQLARNAAAARWEKGWERNAVARPYLAERKAQEEVCVCTLFAGAIATRYNLASCVVLSVGLPFVPR